MKPLHKCPICKQPLEVQTWETDDNLRQAMNCADMAQGFIEYACPRFTLVGFLTGLLISKEERIKSVRLYHSCASLCNDFLKMAISPNRLALQNM